MNLKIKVCATLVLCSALITALKFKVVKTFKGAALQKEALKNKMGLDYVKVLMNSRS